jgi:hypothetical protein
MLFELKPLLPEQGKARVHSLRVIEHALAGFNLNKCGMDAVSWPVGPVGGDGIHYVGYGDNQGFPKDLITLKAPWISGAVQPLVILKHYLRYGIRQLCVF